MTIDLVTRDDAANLIERFARGELAPIDIRRWTGRVLAANDLEIVDDDAAIVAAVINLFEDDSISDDQLVGMADAVACALRLPKYSHSDAEIQTVLCLLATPERFLDLLDGYASDRISHIGLQTALAKTDLPREVRRQLSEASTEKLTRLAAALHHRDVGGIIAAL